MSIVPISNLTISPLQVCVAAGLAQKQKEEKQGERRCLWGEKEEKKRRTVFCSELCLQGHFGCHLFPWRLGPALKAPRASRGLFEKKARYFLRYHLSLSTHNDSPRSSLLMFVIALSHKGHDQWSRSRASARSGYGGLLLVHLIQQAVIMSHIAFTNALQRPFRLLGLPIKPSPLRFRRRASFICVTPSHGTYKYERKTYREGKRLQLTAVKILVLLRLKKQKLITVGSHQDVWKHVVGEWQAMTSEFTVGFKCSCKTAVLVEQCQMTPPTGSIKVVST